MRNIPAGFVCLFVLEGVAVQGGRGRRIKEKFHLKVYLSSEVFPKLPKKP